MARKRRSHTARQPAPTVTEQIIRAIKKPLGECLGKSREEERTFHSVERNFNYRVRYTFRDIVGYYERPHIHKSRYSVDGRRSCSPAHAIRPGGIAHSDHG